MKKIFLVFIFFILISCSYELINTEEFETEPSVQAIFVIDSIKSLFLSYDDKSRIESDWKISLVHNEKNFPFEYTHNYNRYNSFIYKNKIFHDYSQETIRNTVYFGNVSSDWNAVYQISERPSVYLGDSITLTLSKDNQIVSKTEKITPKVKISGFTFEKNVSGIDLNLPSGNYILDIFFFDETEQVVIRSIHKINTKNSIDTTFQIFENSDNTISYFLNEEIKITKISTQTYTEELLGYLFQQYEQTGSHPIGIFDVIGDDVSRYQNVEGNLKPFNGYFGFVNKFIWRNN
jgi:hypothetical protein